METIELIDLLKQGEYNHLQFSENSGILPNADLSGYGWPSRVN